MATLTIRDDRHGRPRYYVLTWSDAEGAHRRVIGRVGAMPEKQARDTVKAKQLELSQGIRILNAQFRPGITFGQCVHDYLLWHQAEYPHSNFRIAQIIVHHLLPRFEFDLLAGITPERTEEMKRERRRKAKAHTVAKELRTLKAVLNWAVARKLIVENPIEHVSAPRILDAKPHFFYERADLAKLYDACMTNVNAGRGPQPDPLHAAIWKLMVNTGMRRGEALHLRKRWVGADGIKIISTDEERTKSGAWREVPKTAGAAIAIDRLRHAVDGEHIIPRFAPSALSRAFVRDASRAGLEGSLHALRHTYISLLMRDTATPVRTIQLYAGHSSIVTTEHYLYLRTDLGRAPAAALDL